MRTPLSVGLVAFLGASAWGQYTGVVLHPAGYYNSVGTGISGGGQAGYATSLGDDHHHALMWSGSAASVVDLHPADYPQSEAFAASGSQQVGRAFDSFSGMWHGLLWGGTAASGRDMNPVGFGGSEIHSTNGTFQAGWGMPVGPVTGPHAIVWMGSHDHATDVNPFFCSSSGANAISPGTSFVGYGTGAWTGTHAIRWTAIDSSAASDIHPAGYLQSWAYGTDGLQDVGFASVAGGVPHAGLWNATGSPSFVDLHPAGMTESFANAVVGGVQVGSAGGPWGYHMHAMLWTGSAGSAVDLHSFLPAGFLGSQALGIDAAGNIIGVAEDGALTYAVMWTAVPAPGTVGLLLAAAPLLARRRR